MEASDFRDSLPLGAPPRRESDVFFIRFSSSEKLLFRVVSCSGAGSQPTNQHYEFFYYGEAGEKRERQETFFH